MFYKNQNTATLATNIKTGIESRLRDVHTAMPGIIESFDPVAQTASVQPAIKRVFKTQEADKEILTPTDLPILINVPVVQPRGGGFSLTFPIAKGDECLLIFCERSIDYWHQNSGIQLPGGKRFHHLSDAIAYVGLSSIPKKVPDYDPVNVQIKKDDGSVSITIKENGDLDTFSQGDTNITAVGDIVANCSNANITASGSIIANCSTAEVTASGSITLTAGSSISLNAPAIALNGAISTAGNGGGPAIMQTTGQLFNNGVNVGSTHSHPQGLDSDGDTQQNTGGPQ